MCEQCAALQRELMFAYWRLESLRERVEYLVKERAQRTEHVAETVDEDNPFA